MDTSDVTCHVRTFKAGVLASVGHDLLLRVTRLTLHMVGQPRRLKATFDAQSLVVVCAMKGGQRLTEALSPRDRKEIERNVARQVLRSDAFDEICFVSEPLDAGLPPRVIGDLTLLGLCRPVEGEVQRVGDRLEARVDLDQRNFGIAPFSAMFGALRVRPLVQILVTAPASLFVGARV